MQAYVLAALRTLGIIAVLFVVLVIGGAIWAAFDTSFVGGCVALCATSAVVSLFGYQLERVAKGNRTQRSGTYTCLIFGAIAVVALLAAAAPPLFVKWIPVLTNAILGPLMTGLGFHPIESEWTLNVIFWLFIALPCLRFVHMRRIKMTARGCNEKAPVVRPELLRRLRRH